MGRHSFVFDEGGGGGEVMGYGSAAKDKAQ